MADPNPEAGGPSGDGSWAVWRIDDNGNTFVVIEHRDRDEAERVAAAFAARGHKQMYWVERKNPGADGQ